MKNNKKSNVLDFFLIIAIIFITAVALFVSFLIVNVVNSTNIFADDTTAQSALDSSKNTLLSFDNMMLFVIVGLSIFVLLSSALVYNHPGYFIAGMFLLAIAVTVAGIASNTFWIFSNTAQIAATAANYPKVTFLMNNLPLYIVFMGFASLIAMFISFQRQ